jgi:hypothetical protein
MVSCSLSQRAGAADVSCLQLVVWLGGKISLGFRCQRLHHFFDAFRCSTETSRVEKTDRLTAGLTLWLAAIFKRVHSGHGPFDGSRHPTRAGGRRG